MTVLPVNCRAAACRRRRIRRACYPKWLGERGRAAKIADYCTVLDNQLLRFMRGRRQAVQDRFFHAFAAYLGPRFDVR